MGGAAVTGEEAKRAIEDLFAGLAVDATRGIPDDADVNVTTEVSVSERFAALARQARDIREKAPK